MPNSKHLPLGLTSLLHYVLKLLHLLQHVWQVLQVGRRTPYPQLSTILPPTLMSPLSHRRRQILSRTFHVPGIYRLQGSLAQDEILELFDGD